MSTPPYAKGSLVKRALAVAVSFTTVVLGLSACGSDTSAVSDDAATSVSTATPSPGISGSPQATRSPTSDNTVTITATVTKGKVDPAPRRVKVTKGQDVELTVTRDTAGEVHVHGYDLDRQAKAGQPVSFSFVADQAGLFEVEAHDPDLLLLQLQVQ